MHLIADNKGIGNSYLYSAKEADLNDADHLLTHEKL